MADTRSAIDRFGARTLLILPGLLLSCGTAAAAWLISQQYDVPVMLMALVFGMMLNLVISSQAMYSSGISFAARDVLRLGIVLLGAGISFELLRGLGLDVIVLVITAVLATLLFGSVAGRLLGKRLDFSLLTAGATAICGASAALAISSILPRTEKTDEELSFTVLAVTILSTLAMFGYPVLAGSLGLSDRSSGIFIGASIHDVAQVVGAGFSVSEEAGQMATLVKLARVVMLAPVVLLLALIFRHLAGAQPVVPINSPPLLPAFVLGFLGIAAMNSFGMIPVAVAGFLNGASRAALVVAIAAVGLKTSLRSLRSFGGLAIGLVLLETLFIAGFILAGLTLAG